MSETQARPAVDVERAAIGWRVAAAGDEQDAANFAYDHMDEILADLARVTAERDRAREERDAMVGVVEAARYCHEKDRITPMLCVSLADLDAAQQKPS